MDSAAASSMVEPEVEGNPDRPQQTLAQDFVCTGVGLHSGETTTVRVMPAAVNEGRYFVRVDLVAAHPPSAVRSGTLEKSAAMITATLDQVGQTRLSTELGQSPAQGRVRTVEHLLAALWALGIDNARIEIDGPEVPLLDGSAQDWATAIRAAGVVAQAASHHLPPPLAQPVSVQMGDAFAVAMPSPELRFSYGIDFDLTAIGNQWHSWSPETGPEFIREIAPARTFGLAHQIEFLREQGLIKGGSLDNALVCGPTGWINPPLRFANEPVRHKLLDLVGDLSLLGKLPRMHVMAYKASHQLHVQLAQKLRQVIAA
jgi:UDP-3-O-[3-hydroxymyristoyl] N-acetylglucosamine deacetylase